MTRFRSTETEKSPRSTFPVRLRLRKCKRAQCKVLHVSTRFVCTELTSSTNKKGEQDWLTLLFESSYFICHHGASRRTKNSLHIFEDDQEHD